MTPLEAVSITLAVVAIVLSIVFYWMSKKETDRSTTSASNIQASVDKLESLMGTYYKDSFSMTQKLVTDLSSRAFSAEVTGNDKIAEEAKEKADEKIEALQVQMEERFTTILKQQDVTDEKVATVRDEMRAAVAETISMSRIVENETQEMTFRGNLVNVIRDRKITDIIQIYNILLNDHSISVRPSILIEELLDMEKEGIISISGKSKPDSLLGGEEIKLLS